MGILAPSTLQQTNIDVENQEFADQVPSKHSWFSISLLVRPEITVSPSRVSPQTLRTTVPVHPSCCVTPGEDL